MSSRRSRMSLGGGALRRGVLDGSSRYNIRSAASDDEYQMTPQKSYSSRQSLGGDSLLSRSTYGAGNGATSNGVVDRRAMLEKWRQQRNAAAAASSDGNSENASVETRKRHRGDPPLPPVSKQQRSTNSHYSHQSIEMDHSDDETENRGYGGSVLSGRTPSSNRRMTMGSARRKTPLLGRSVVPSNREGKKHHNIPLIRDNS